MRELFVYYRIDLADEATVLAMVHRSQAALIARQPALRARLLVKAERKDGQRACMETYATDPALAPDGIDDDCEAAISAEACALTPMLRSPRHVEIFIACR